MRSGGEGDFLSPSDNELVRLSILGEVKAKDRLGLVVFDEATVDQLDVLTLVGRLTGVRIGFEGLVGADFPQEHT
jgi:hypothetical protein